MGYLNREAETKEVFSEDHWLKLGDLGCLDHDDFHLVYGKPETFIKLNTGELVMPQKVGRKPVAGKQFMYFAFRASYNETSAVRVFSFIPFY